MVIQKWLCQFYILLTKVNKILAVSAHLLLGAMELLRVPCHFFDVLLCFQSISEGSVKVFTPRTTFSPGSFNP